MTSIHFPSSRTRCTRTRTPDLLLAGPDWTHGKRFIPACAGYTPAWMLVRSNATGIAAGSEITRKRWCSAADMLQFFRKLFLGIAHHRYPAPAQFVDHFA